MSKMVIYPGLATLHDQFNQIMPSYTFSGLALWRDLVTPSGGSTIKLLELPKSNLIALQSTPSAGTANDKSIILLKGSGFSYNFFKPTDTSAWKGKIEEIWSYNGGSYSKGVVSGGTLVGKALLSSTALQIISGDDTLTLNGSFPQALGDFAALAAGTTYSGPAIGVTSFSLSHKGTTKFSFALSTNKITLTSIDLHNQWILTGTHFPTSLSVDDIQQIMAGTWNPVEPLVTQVDSTDTTNNAPLFSSSGLQLSLNVLFANLQGGDPDNPFAAMIPSDNGVLDGSNITSGLTVLNGTIAFLDMSRALLGSYPFATLIGGSGADLLSALSWKLKEAGSLTDQKDLANQESSDPILAGSDPAVGGSGQWLAFASSATNLVGNDSNGKRDIFLRNMQNGAIQGVSSTASLQADGDSRAPALSADGRYLLFASEADNLTGSGSSDANGVSDLFLRDIQGGMTTCISVAANGQATGDAASSQGQINANGSMVVFQSDADNLVSDDANSATDIFLRTLAGTPTTTCISLSYDGGAADGNSSAPKISADGRYILFDSSATNLIDGDFNDLQDVFLRDTQTNTTTLISQAKNGDQANGASWNSQISANGRTLLFLSDASNLVNGDNNGVTDLFLRDTLNQTTIRVDLASDGSEANGAVGKAQLSRDGRFVLFSSTATDLVSVDQYQSIALNFSGQQQSPGFYYLRDLLLGSTTILPFNAVDLPVISADGATIAFISSPDGVNLGSGAATDGVKQIYWATLGTAATLQGGEGKDTLLGSLGADTLDGGAGADTLSGDRGNDTYIVDNSGDIVSERVDSGIDLVKSSIRYSLPANVENLTLTGSAPLNGTGNELSNTLTGTDGNNTLDGGSGADTLIGGKGDDLYLVDNSGDLLCENSAGGTDTVRSSVSYTLSPNVENLILTGSAMSGSGNGLANTLTGTSGNNTLDGQGGADTLIGGSGDDTYLVDNSGDLVVEKSGEGSDRILSSVSYTLTANVENLTLTGNSAINGAGNELVNTLLGNGGNNTLDGRGNADTLIGGLGDDTYIVDNSGDILIENASEGTDTVRSSISYSLVANLDNLILTGSGNLNGTGNSLVNTLTGTDGNNTLDGGGGADTLIGGKGNDLYIVDNSGDLVMEKAGEGTDSVISSVSYTLSTNVENLTLTGSDPLNGAGNDLVNTLIGNSGSNILDGNGGADTLIGGGGDDTYLVDNSGDLVIEKSGEGIDWVWSSVTYTLAANVDDLLLTGNGAINGLGNELANTLIGNSGNNTLDGKGGADTLIGGAGDDTYIVDNSSDILLENSGGGNDTVKSSISYSLTANLENLILTGSGNLNATGNGLVNTLIGTDGNNTLDGGGGADTLIGGKGNDLYIVDNSSDLLVEKTGEGTDWVLSSVSYTLTANLENLTLTGSDFLNGAGNELVNTLIGNSGSNTLDGKGGADTLIGGGGDDTYIVDNSGDWVVEKSGEGNDLVLSSLTYTLTANVENLTLTGSGASNATGNGLANTLIGNDSNNILNDGGSGGIDTLIGGKGNDTYIINNTGDLVIENSGGGTDGVQSSVSYTLAAQVENLTLTGSGAINGTGNALANTLTGNDSANILDDGGVGGNDTLTGGKGNDTYLVNNTGDLVVEKSGEGTDLVISSVSYTLAANLENLTLTGSAGSATGNDLANTLTGTSGNNTLDGKGGADTLIGGGSDDTYIVDNSGDLVVEKSGEGIDSVLSSVTHTLAANVENLTLTGTGAINGMGNDLANILIGNGQANTLQGKGGADTLTGGSGADIFLYTAPSDGGDTITDFKSSEGDKIAFSSPNFGKISAINATNFESNATGIASTAAVRFIFNTGNGSLSYDGDGNGSTMTPVLIATLNVRSLKGSDLQIYSS